MDQESLIGSAVNQFPTIKSKIGTSILISLAKKDAHSPIIYYLTKSIPDESKVQETVKVLQDDPNHIGALVTLDYHLRPHYILNHLDWCLSIIRNENKLDTLLEHLLNPNSFWQGYSEIEVAAYLKVLSGEIELEPKLDDKKSADIKFQLNSESIFAEVTVPKSHYKFIRIMQKSAKEHKVVELKAPIERASDKILDELKHFANVLDKVLSVIIVNLNDTEIEDIDIEEALMGVSKLEVLTNRTTGKTETRVIREKWTAFDLDEKLKKIGAIICYKRNFTLNGDVKFEKRVFGLSFDVPLCENILKLFP